MTRDLIFLSSPYKIFQAHWIFYSYHFENFFLSWRCLGDFWKDLTPVFFF